MENSHGHPRTVSELQERRFRPRAVSCQLRNILLPFNHGDLPKLIFLCQLCVWYECGLDCSVKPFILPQIWKNVFPVKLCFHFPTLCFTQKLKSNNSCVFILSFVVSSISFSYNLSLRMSVTLSSQSSFHCAGSLLNRRKWFSTWETNGTRRRCK